MDASLPSRASHSPTQRNFDEAELRVEILDEWGGRIDGLQIDHCKTLVGSGVQEVTWMNRDCAPPLEGKPVRLKFEYRNAALYGFQFE